VNIYTKEFFEKRASGSSASARRIVPMIVNLLRPRSVLDVGCGVGSWLAVFREHGVTDMLGIDGDYVPVERLEIPASAFRSADLSSPVRLDRSFHLVVCLEVAGHLSPEHAGTLVESLCGLGPVVRFPRRSPSRGGRVIRMSIGQTTGPSGLRLGGTSRLIASDRGFGTTAKSNGGMLKIPFFRHVRILSRATPLCQRRRS
jgi:hypothetical protein